VVNISDFISLPYTHDLTEGGIAYALRSVPYTYNRMGGSPYDRLRRIAAGVAVELAFRRFLSEQNIPFDVKGATPFTDPDRYDVALGGRKCDIKSFLITYRTQIKKMKLNPQIILGAPALVPSDQSAVEGYSDKDIYIFAFLSGLVAVSQDDLQKVIYKNRPYYLVHVMPNSWIRPSKWNSLGSLVLKSESSETQTVEIGGQDEKREMWSIEVKIPPQTRVQIDDRFFSVSYIRSKSQPGARIGVYSPAYHETHLIGAMEWDNIWIYGMDILLVGWLTRAEFNRHANPIREGSRVFQYDRTRTKNLGVPVDQLKSLSDLLEKAKEWSK